MYLLNCSNGRHTNILHTEPAAKPVQFDPLRLNFNIHSATPSGTSAVSGASNQTADEEEGAEGREGRRKASVKVLGCAGRGRNVRTERGTKRIKRRRKQRWKKYTFSYCLQFYNLVAHLKTTPENWKQEKSRMVKDRKGKMNNKTE